MPIPQAEGTQTPSGEFSEPLETAIPYSQGGNNSAFFGVNQTQQYSQLDKKWNS